MNDRTNRWQGFVLGLLGGAVGTIAMGGYWRVATALVGSDPRAATVEGGPRALDDISLIGHHHQETESSTAAIGRHLFTALAHHPPEADETKTVLSYIVHYSYGSVQGGVYGAMIGGGVADIPRDGAAFGTALWLFGDEGAISLLGLAEGPTKYPLSQHLHRWGAHLVFGLATVATTTALRRVL